MKISKSIVILGLCGMLSCQVTWAADKHHKKDGPKLVLVQLDHWKTKFFGLPNELPILLSPGETFDPKKGHYDFMQGIKAMEIYINIQPKNNLSKAYRRFMQKWPLYQKFFKSVDQENYDQAEAILNEVATIDGKDPAVHFYRGSLKTHLKKYQAAEKHYRQCLKYFPDYGPAYIHLARLAKARGDDQSAKQYLEEAVKRVGPNEQEGAGSIARKMLDSLTK